MADSVEEEPTAEATQPEPNLTDIQATVATILRENRELKQAIIELKSALNANQRETEKLKTQLTKAERAIDTLRNDITVNPYFQLL